MSSLVTLYLFCVTVLRFALFVLRVVALVEVLPFVVFVLLVFVLVIEHLFYFLAFV